jgi:flagellar basal body-associated protein FliL
MSRKKLMMGGGGVTVLCLLALLVVSSMGIPGGNLGPGPRPGEDAYYMGEPQVRAMPEVLVNLKGSRGEKYLLVESSVIYRLGADLEEAESLFDRHLPSLQDRLNMLIGSKSYEDVEGVENKNLLKEEIRGIVEHLVFPDRHGRIEEVLFRKFQTQ